jgi:hypothetical protein
MKDLTHQIWVSENTSKMHGHGLNVCFSGHTAADGAQGTPAPKKRWHGARRREF